MTHYYEPERKPNPNYCPACHYSHDGPCPWHSAEAIDRKERRAHLRVVESPTESSGGPK